MGMRRRYRKKGGIRRLVKGKGSAIKTLAKAVRSIQVKNKKQVRYLNFQQTSNVTNISGTAPTVLPLSDFNSMGWCFGTGSDDLSDSKLIHSSFGIDNYITLENLINNEEETIQFTCMLVSLRDPATQIYNFQTNTFSWNSTPNTSNQTHAVSGGLVLLNKKYFKIHKTKRFVLSNHGTPLTNPSASGQYGIDQRFYWKFSPNALIENPGGNVLALRNGADPSKTYFMLVFSDNSAADLESPAWTYTAVHTMRTVA